MAGYVSKQAADRWNRTAKIVADGGAGFGVGSVPFAESGELPLIFKNVSGIEIPPYACVQLTGTTESGTTANYLNATRPVDITGKAGPYGFNGPTRVAAGALGSLQSGPVYHAIYDSGVQAAGRKYHPIKDSFKLKGAGFGVGCGLWSFVGTDDIIADTIRVKTCGGGEVACDELADLVVGTYRGICGATIAPGASGLVQVTDCNSAVQTITATNHTNCTFYAGERISVHITPCCTAHFDGCSCCGDAPACCDRSVGICVAGVSVLIAVNGGTYTWDVSGCTGCEGATLEIDLACTADPLDITATWTYTCGESTETGTLDWDGLCSDPATEYEDVIVVASGVIPVLATASLESCGPCDLPDQPCTECELTTITVGDTSFSTAITNIESSTFSISDTTLETDDIVTITAVLSMVGSADTETGRFRISLGGSTCLYASPDSNRSGFEGPPTIGNPPTPACDDGSYAEWQLTVHTETTITCTAIFRKNGCLGGVSFLWDSTFLGADQTVSWAGTCGECGGGGPGGEGGGI